VLRTGPQVFTDTVCGLKLVNRLDKLLITAQTNQYSFFQETLEDQLLLFKL